MPRLFRLLFLFGLGAMSSHAQDIQQAYTIPLQTFSYVDPGTSSVYYKYGINIGIGGGTAQTFEFDTGGEGFYAADVAHGWWGSQVADTSDTFTKNFGSGLSYSGTVSNVTGLAFFGAAGSTVPILGVGNNFKVGRAETIVQSSGTLWSGTSTNTSPAPVQDAFYGDFGLTLKKGAHGVENVFAQLSYGNGVTGGYIVSTGTYGSPNGAGYVQVGLTAADLNNPHTTWFQMSGSSATETFTGGHFATYSAELLRAQVTLSKENGGEYAFEIGVNLDTGNPTPGIDYSSEHTGHLSDFSNEDMTSLLDGVTLSIDAIPEGEDIEQRVLDFLAGNLRGVNLVYESERKDGGDTYLNIGTKIFQQFQVTYDLANGRIGFTPYAVPEPGAFALLAGAAALLLVRRRLPFPSRMG